MIKLVTASAVLVLAIVFGFIFWNQFSSNQRQLAGNTPSTEQSSLPKNDNLDLIDTDLNNIDINSIDSDSTQMDAQLRSF